MLISGPLVAEAGHAGLKVSPLAQVRRAGDVAGQARALNAVGWHSAVQGDHQRGLVYSQQALDLQRKLGDRYGEVDT